MSVFPSLEIGNLVINPPIIQGGMGVRVSLANLASAVANEGGAGIIATAGIGDFLNHPGSRFLAVNEAALRHEIRSARTQTNGIIGINAMVALSNYENLAITAAEVGLLVMATLHTRSASSTVERIIEVFPIDQQ